MNDRILYLASIVAISAISLLGGIFSIVGIYPLGIALIGVAVALFPLSSHLRMRRMVASIARSIPASQTKSSPDYSTQLKTLSAKMDELSQAVNLISRQNNNESDSESLRAAKDLQRETRALRLTLREVEGLNAHTLSSAFSEEQQNIADEKLK